MANRFWVLGAGTWNASSTANWSATTGGSAGASAPTTSDSVTFDTNSGTGVVTTATGATCLALTYNSSTLSSLTLGANFTTLTGGIILTNGTFDANGWDVSTALVSLGVGTKSLIMGSGTWTLSGGSVIWDMTTNNTGLTFSGASAPIIISNSSITSKQLSVGTALSYNKITIGGGASTSSIQFNSTTSTFLELASTRTTAYSISFAIGVPTITTWSVTGSAGNVVSVISSAPSSQRTISITNKTTNIDYLSIRDINSVNVTPVTFWAGANSTNVSNNKGIAFASGALNEAYVLTTGTSFTRPANWGNAPNSIYLIGGGGGSSGSVASGNNRAGGAGGGGGGFRLLTNQTLASTTAYQIGAAGVGGALAGTGGTGGTTSWDTTNTATGGAGGTVSTTPTSVGGAGGTGTFTGGTGGAGATSTTAGVGNGGGGGGGAAGSNGNGGNGGAGSGATTTTNIAGGGGGGNGGGTAGGDAVGTSSGAGGNNSLGSGGSLAVTSGNGIAGIKGGGGSGALINFTGGAGSGGIEILEGFGSGSGSGGMGSVASTGFGAGGSGRNVATSGTTSTGNNGNAGAIIIVYTPSGAPSINSGFFFLFG